MTKQPEQRIVRINARLNEQESAQLEYLMHLEGKSVTEVVRESIEQRYKAAHAEHATAANALMRTGFIGSGEGPTNLSKTYKKQLKGAWTMKHGDR